MSVSLVSTSSSCTLVNHAERSFEVDRLMEGFPLHWILNQRDESRDALNLISISICLRQWPHSLKWLCQFWCKEFYINHKICNYAILNLTSSAVLENFVTTSILHLGRIYVDDNNCTIKHNFMLLLSLHSSSDCLQKQNIIFLAQCFYKTLKCIMEFNILWCAVVV